MAIDRDLGTGEPAAVHDRSVVQLVREDHVARAGERADRSDVREIARAEEDAGLAALERGEPLLESPVDRHRPGNQARGAGADAPAHGRVRRGLADARMVGEPEVVVRAQQQTGLPSSSTRGP